METKVDLGTAAIHVIAAARQIGSQTGLSEELAVARATEGALQAAELIGPEAVAKVKESLTPEAIPLDSKGLEDDE